MDYRWKVTNTGGRSPGTRVPMVAQILQRNADVVNLRRRAAEQRDELAPFQLIEMHSIPASQGRFAGYRIGEDHAVPQARNEAGWQGGAEANGRLSLKTPKSVRAAEKFSRTRLSQSFFMRDFLFSEIAAIEGLSNLPDDPELAIAAGRGLCENLLEPLQAT